MAAAVVPVGGPPEARPVGGRTARPWPPRGSSSWAYAGAARSCAVRLLFALVFLIASPGSAGRLVRGAGFRRLAQVLGVGAARRRASSGWLAAGRSGRGARRSTSSSRRRAGSRAAITASASRSPGAAAPVRDLVPGFNAMAERLEADERQRARCSPTSATSCGRRWRSSRATSRRSSTASTPPTPSTSATILDETRS